MFKSAFRFTKFCFVFAAITTVSVGAGLAFYAAQGGDVSSVAQDLSRSFERLKSRVDPKAINEKGKDLRENAEELTAAAEKAKSAVLSATELAQSTASTLYATSLVRQNASTLAATLFAPQNASSQEQRDETSESAPPSGSADVSVDAVSANPDPATAANYIRVYFAPCDPSDPFGIDDAFLQFIRSAKKSIYCAFYDLELPAAAEALISKHNEGVEVAIVSDSDYKKREAIQRCMAAGIQVVFDNREPFMHDKFCVVDETFIWTGSTNITENCMYRNDNNSVLISSPNLAKDYRMEFDEMFHLHSFGKGSPRNTPYSELVIGDVDVECYFAPEDCVEEAITRRIGAAGNEVDFLAFSFTSAPIAKAMAERISAGVKVRGVFDKTQAKSSSKYCQYKFLANLGADVRFDKNPNLMHDKIIIIDDSLVVTGSFNFSKSANTENDENVLMLHSREIAGQYKATFEKIFGAN
jgi:phosphatidylserine/phosphatidylglycerophosphate/cardiolipin synthase-like enzyme